MSIKMNNIHWSFLFLLWGSILIAQPTTNAPYSRLGIGDLEQQQFASNLGMGGLSAAFTSPVALNYRNPASLSYLFSATYEVGLFASYTKLTKGDSESKLW